MAWEEFQIILYLQIEIMCVSVCMYKTCLYRHTNSLWFGCIWPCTSGGEGIKCVKCRQYWPLTSEMNVCLLQSEYELQHNSIDNPVINKQCVLVCPSVLGNVKAIAWSSLHLNIHLGIFLDLPEREGEGRVVHAFFFSGVGNVVRGIWRKPFHYSLKQKIFLLLLSV